MVRNISKKFTLTGADNDGFRQRYSIKKNEDFKKSFVKFMTDLDFDENSIKKPWEVSYENEKGEDIKKELKIKEVEDACLNHNNKKFDVDVFYGRFKVIIVVRTKTRIPVIRHLEKKSKWIKPFIIKKIKEGKKIPLVITKPTKIKRDEHN